MPLAGNLIDQGPSGDSRGKPHGVHDVPDLGVHRVLAIALDDALLVSVRDLDCLVRREERRADPGALATCRQHGSEGPPAGDAPGGDHGSAPGNVEHLSQERKRAEAPGVATGSLPWATRTSAPRSRARRAASGVWTWHKTLAPTRLASA